MSHPDIDKIAKDVLPSREQEKCTHPKWAIVTGTVLIEPNECGFNKGDVTVTCLWCALVLKRRDAAGKVLPCYVEGKAHPRCASQS